MGTRQGQPCYYVCHFGPGAFRVLTVIRANSTVQNCVAAVTAKWHAHLADTISISRAALGLDCDVPECDVDAWHPIELYPHDLARWPPVAADFGGITKFCPIWADGKMVAALLR